MIGDFEHVFIDGTVRLHALVKGEGPLVLVHVGAAVYHHVVQKDDVLRRMLPGKGTQAL